MISFPRPVIAVTALGLALVLGSALMGVRTQTQPQTRTQTTPQTQAQVHPPTTRPASPLAAYPLDRLSATRNRPLFTPSRRPPAPAPAPMVAAAPPPQPPKLILFGIVMDSDEARAVVGVGTGEKTRRVRIGDDIGGWKVTQIEERQLVLSLDDRSATFTLFSSQHAGPGAAQPLSAPVRRQKD
jgi:type II secretory pathway component PulC